MGTEIRDGVSGNLGVMERRKPSHSASKSGNFFRHLRTFPLGLDKDLYPFSLLREDTAPGAEIRIGSVCELFQAVFLPSASMKVQPLVGDQELNLHVLERDLAVPTNGGYVPALELGVEKLPIGPVQQIRRLLLPQGRGQFGTLHADGRFNLCHLRANGTGLLYCVYLRWSVSGGWWKIDCCLPSASVWPAGTQLVSCL